MAAIIVIADVAGVLIYTLPPQRHDGSGFDHDCFIKLLSVEINFKGTVNYVKLPERDFVNTVNPCPE